MNWILRMIGKKFDGYRTAIGGIGLILLGIIGYINIIWPESVPLVPVLSVNEAWASISGGLVAIGIGGKIEKNTAAVKEATNAGQAITTPAIKPERQDPLIEY